MNRIFIWLRFFLQHFHIYAPQGLTEKPEFIVNTF